MPQTLYDPKRVALFVAALATASILWSPDPAFASGPAWEPGETRCVPNFRDEKPVGYLCVAVDPKSEYSQIGLRRGDNVYAINGQSVFDPEFKGDNIERAIDLWQGFDKDNSGTLSVERGDQRLDLWKTPRRLDRERNF